MKPDPRPTTTSPQLATPATQRVPPPSERVRLRRKPDRGRYDLETIGSILDEALVGSVGWVLDGQPYVTPVTIWRQGRRLYWHASAGSRVVRATSHGEPVCVTAWILDGLVFARSGTNHAMNFRSVIVLGRAHAVTDEAEKSAALDNLIDHLAPGRAAGLRPATAEELRKTAVLWVDLDEASAKIRTGGVNDEPGDEGWPIWAGMVPVSVLSGRPVADAHSSGPAPAGLGGPIARPRPRRSATPR
ncbi:MAG TPA: pyridoxamine 5'-phosphate oxidase family protein [Candidatus Limnocylindrales bacterium]|nr:pyridoxamine 5'-phosphate oxidase family protein [Candidatus Limnocylindrales bacterium]